MKKFKNFYEEADDLRYIIDTFQSYSEEEWKMKEKIDIARYAFAKDYYESLDVNEAEFSNDEYEAEIQYYDLTKLLDEIRRKLELMHDELWEDEDYE